MRPLLTLLLLAAALTGCRDDHPTLVALLVADEQETLAQPMDVDAFRERVEQRCDDCVVEVYDASGDAAAQETAFDEALGQEAAVVVIEPVAAERAEELAARAGEVPVVAYGELVPGADSFVGLESQPPSGAGAEGAVDDLAAARAVVLGKEKSMVYVPATRMSTHAADVALGLVAETPVEGSTEHEGVPAWLYESHVVTRKDVADVLLKERAVELEELCSGETAKRCTALGLR